jgi:hypothetical protein
MTAEVRSPTPVRRILSVFEHEGSISSDSGGGDEEKVPNALEKGLVEFRDGDMGMIGRIEKGESGFRV